MSGKYFLARGPVWLRGGVPRAPMHIKKLLDPTQQFLALARATLLNSLNVTFSLSLI